MFDRTDPADLLALQTEVLTDPIAMGYVPDSTQTGVIKPINDPSSNTGDGSPGQETQVSRVFDVAAMLDALDPSEFEAQQTVAGAETYVNTLAVIGNDFSGGDITPYKAKFRSMFAANSATVTALDAQVQDISRAEALFGQGTIITRDDWIAAQAYTP